MRSLFVVFVSLCCALSPARAAEQIWPTLGWETSTPEEQGMDSAALAKLVAFGKTRSFDSLLLVRHGRIVLDAYYAPYSPDIPHAINSSTKAVIGTLTAMAMKEGLLDSLDHPALDFFRDRQIENIDERKKAITIANLLDMSSGFEWEEGVAGGREQSLADMSRSADWIKFVLDRPMAHPPGEVFYYNSGNPHLLSAIIFKLTGKRAEDYAKAKLFKPLGIETSYWRRDSQGLSIGGGGLSLLPRDMAKIGYLYLHHGEWLGEQLLPVGWDEAIAHATLNMNTSFDPSLRYRNFFWVLPDKRAYMAVGYHCQVIMVLPDRDVVAVMTARNFCPFGRIADAIAGAVKSEKALPQDQSAADQLAHEIADISTEKASEVGATPEIASAISGRTYKFPGNALNVKSLALFLSGNEPRYAMELNTQIGSLSANGPLGLDGLYRKGRPTSFGFVPTAKGTWSDEHTFVLDLQFLGSGEERRFDLTFDGEGLTLKGRTRDGREVSVASQPE
jgi:CubicO group peptidase (beta-lactamase class C family)